MDGAAVTCTSAEDPTAATEDRTCEALNETAGFRVGGGPELHRPSRRVHAASHRRRNKSAHAEVIGASRVECDGCSGLKRRLPGNQTALSHFVGATQPGGKSLAGEIPAWQAQESGQMM